MTNLIKICLLGSLFFTIASGSQNMALADELSTQAHISARELLNNVSRADTPPGTIIASPSRHDPDYYFHWVRDGALVVQVILGLIERGHKDSDELIETLKDFVSVTLAQQSNSINFLGEPKYEISTAPFQGPWARPQNDGPALRATVLIQFARMLIARGDHDYVKRFLYNAEIPAHTAIKRDLEYSSHRWQDHCYDLWEEIKAHNFYTRAAIYNALVAGAEFARDMNDSQASFWYLTQAENLKHAIKTHYENSTVIRENLERIEGIDHKHSNLDIASILALLHNKGANQVLQFDHPKVLETARQLEQGFVRVYTLNYREQPGLSPAIGRYFEDVYYGGNPWFLTTFALAEYYYMLAKGASNELDRSRYFKKGDSFLKRGLFHKGSNGHMSEQFHRENGFMLSARDLTWSYAAYLTAFWARSEVPQ